MNELIEPEKEVVDTDQVCPKCGSDTFDRGTFEWCPSCGWEDYY